MKPGWGQAGAGRGAGAEGLCSDRAAVVSVPVRATPRKTRPRPNDCFDWTARRPSHPSRVDPQPSPAQPRLSQAPTSTNSEPHSGRAFAVKLPVHAACSVRAAPRWVRAGPQGPGGAPDGARGLWDRGGAYVHFPPLPSIGISGMPSQPQQHQQQVAVPFPLAVGRG